MIYSLGGLIPGAHTQTSQPSGIWVAAVPLPWYPGLWERVTDAWAVFREQAVAVRYPQPCDFERAMYEAGWTVSPRLARAAGAVD